MGVGKKVPDLVMQQGLTGYIRGGTKGKGLDHMVDRGVKVVQESCVKSIWTVCGYFGENGPVLCPSSCRHRHGRAPRMTVILTHLELDSSYPTCIDWVFLQFIGASFFLENTFRILNIMCSKPLLCKTIQMKMGPCTIIITKNLQWLQSVFAKVKFLIGYFL